MEVCVLRSDSRQAARRRYALRCVRSENGDWPSPALRGLRRLRRPSECFVCGRNLCSLRTHGLSVSGQSGTPLSAPPTGSGKLATDVERRRIAALCVDFWRQEASVGVPCSLADHSKRLDVTAPCL